MPETIPVRVTRLERSMDRAFSAIRENAQQTRELRRLVAALARAQMQTEKRFQETDRRFQETERLMRQGFQELDNRIGKLVSAIGELIRRRDGS